MTTTRIDRTHRSNGRPVDGRVPSRGRHCIESPESCSNDLIDETIAVWQPHAQRSLTREDGRQIIENMTGFFRVLHEWQRAERAGKKPRKRTPVETKDNVAPG